jgi:Icc-related predicted phosphoesterase
MKIMATSDIHGNKKIISKLVSAYEKSDAEMLLICGDIGGKGYRTHSITEFGQRQREDYDYLVSNLSQCKKSFRCILGNDDWFDLVDDYCLCTGEMSGNIVAFDWVSITPFNTNREVNENKIWYELSKLDINAKSVILAHCPPHMAQDRIHMGTHVGSLSIREFITKRAPKIWFCGHIHENHGASKIGKTLVINCACDHLKDQLRAVIVDTETLEYNFIEL